MEKQPRIPEKYAKLLLDEPTIADEVVKMGNIYYLFSWLNEKRQWLVFEPDGEMKSVYVPMEAFSFDAFEAFIVSVRKEFPLLSGGISLQPEYYSHSKIIYLDENNKKISEKSFPIVKISVFLKHLKPFIQRLVEHGFIAKSGSKAIKEYRAIICDANEGGGYWFHSGVSERGFAHFCLDFTSDQSSINGI
jgi:hypothetical protein